MYGINATALLPINPQTYKKISKFADGYFFFNYVV